MANGVSEAEFLAKLAGLGIRKQKLWDLVTGPNDYDPALPLILEHVFLIQGPNERHTLAFREGLIRSLLAPAAKKLPDLWPRLMDLFKGSANITEKWVVANTLERVVTKKQLAEVIAILSEKAHAMGREPFCRAARRLHFPEVIAPLVAMLHEKRHQHPDPDSAHFPYGEQLSPAHPITALGWLGGAEVIPEIEPFLADCYPGTETPDPYVRSEARKAIDRIRKRTSGATPEQRKPPALPRKPAGGSSKPKDDWFRNDRWDPEEEADFYRRLSRCRTDFSRAQNARIKSLGLLRSGDPARVRAAVTLLNRIVAEWPVESEISCCYWQLAEGHARLGELDQAIESFHKCFAQEERHRNSRTGAWMDFARFVVDRRLNHLYTETLDLLDRYSPDALFPIDRFVHHGARALIHAERGASADARREAEAALHEARKTHSGMAKHPGLGVVGGDNPWIPRLARLLGQE